MCVCVFFCVAVAVVRCSIHYICFFLQLAKFKMLVCANCVWALHIMHRHRHTWKQNVAPQVVFYIICLKGCTIFTALCVCENCTWRHSRQIYILFDRGAILLTNSTFVDFASSEKWRPMPICNTIYFNKKPPPPLKQIWRKKKINSWNWYLHTQIFFPRNTYIQ